MNCILFYHIRFLWVTKGGILSKLLSRKSNKSIMKVVHSVFAHDNIKYSRENKTRF